MQKTLIIISVLMAFATASYAGPNSQQWIKKYGTSNDIVVDRIQQTIDGGYIAAGFLRDLSSVFDLLVMKLDVNGNISWKKTYRYGSWINDAYAIQQTLDGGYIVAGFAASMSFVTGWILKLDGNGNILWQKAYEGVTEFKSIQQTTDGEYIAVGAGHIGVILLKLDSTGGIVWRKSYRGDCGSVLQTHDEGYILVGAMKLNMNQTYDIWVLKVDMNGNIAWQKSYDGGGNNLSPSIQQTADGGYVLASECGGSETEDAWVLKLDSTGNVLWQKTYGGDGSDYIASILQTANGGYVLTGRTSSFSAAGDADVWLLELDNNGSIMQERTYGGPDWDIGMCYGETAGGGGVIAGGTYYFGADEHDLMILKLDSNGEVPDCDYIGNSLSTVSWADMIVQDTTNGTVESPPITIVDTYTVPQEISLDTSVVCYYEDANDIDGDGVDSDPGGEMAGSMYSSSFLAEGDNCSDMPNGPYLGTCTSGKVASTCIADAACGPNGVCSMNQEDTLPPQGNDIGDACDCEGNFNCDADVDGSDAALLKADFGRSAIIDPCIAGDTCKGDFNCDGDVDGTDASLFKADFGRSSIQNPCPGCVPEAWCGY